MFVFFNPPHKITGYPAGVTLMAENETDRSKLRAIAEALPQIVIGESRNERTGETAIIEIGLPRNEGG